MTDIDNALRESLGRLAEPGDPSGVVAAVNAKADAIASGAAGAGGGAAATGGGFIGWIPAVLIATLALGVGAYMGVQPTGGGGTTATYAPLTVNASGGVPAALCPGAGAVTSLDPGARVLAVARTESGD